MPALLLPDPARAAALVDSRLALHAAAQVPATLGTTHLPDAGDFQHTNLGWHEGLRALLGRPVDGLRAGLVVPTMTWVVVDDAKQRVRARKDAAGATLDEGRAWLAAAAAEHGGPVGELSWGSWERPDHPAATGGAALPAPAEADLEELARWFALAHQHLTNLGAGEPRATEPRVWPHHFDLATLVLLDDDAEGGRRVGLGLSPGDADIAEPYLYGNPWPAPDDRAGPSLPVGTWHTEGWFGAVLRGSEGGERPDVRAAAFWAGALAAGLDLLGSA